MTVKVKGEVLGHGKPILALTVQNPAQGWFHDGHLSPKEAKALAAELNAWADKHEAEAIR